MLEVKVFWIDLCQEQEERYGFEGRIVFIIDTFTTSTGLEAIAAARPAPTLALQKIYSIHTEHINAIVGYSLLLKRKLCNLSESNLTRNCQLHVHGNCNVEALSNGQLLLIDMYQSNKTQAMNVAELVISIKMNKIWQSFHLR